MTSVIRQGKTRTSRSVKTVKGGKDGDQTVRLSHFNKGQILSIEVRHDRSQYAIGETSISLTDCYHSVHMNGLTSLELDHSEADRGKVVLNGRNYLGKTIRVVFFLEKGGAMLHNIPVKNMLPEDGVGIYEGSK